MTDRITALFPGVMKYYIPPDENQLRGQALYMKEQHDKAPRRRPGDRFTLFGALVGVIVGVWLGVRTLMPLWIVLGLIIGGAAGAVIGSLIGRMVVRHQMSRRWPSKFETSQGDRYDKHRG